MERYEIRVLNGVTVATPRKKKKAEDTPAERREKQKAKPKQKGINNEEGD